MSNIDEQDALSKELHDRSQDINGYPIGFESVRQSARRIARRRRIATGVVAAAVLTIAVPTALALNNGTDRSGDPVGPNPSPTVTQSAAPRPSGPVELTTHGLPRGEDPQVSYFQDGDNKGLVTPQGIEQLPVALQGVTRYDGGWIGLGYDGRGAEMFILNPDMNITDRFPSGQAFAVSSDASQVAYVQIEQDGTQTLVNAPADGTVPVTWTFAERPPVNPVGFVDADTVLYRTEEETQQVGLATLGGGTKPLDGFVKVTGANMANGLVAGQTRSQPDGSGCFGVMDPASSTTEMLWETCDYSLSSFSPDGQFVLASDAYLSGSGTRSTSVLDAQTGELVVTYQQPRKSQVELTQTVWEDNGSILASAREGLDWTILRMTTGGELEASTDPVEASPYSDFYYTFAEPR